MGFAEDIAKFVSKCNGNADAVVRKTVLDIGKSLVEKTPVGDADYWKSKPPAGYVGGHARANWSYSEGKQDIKVFEGVDATGGVSNDRIAAALPQNAAGKVHFIQNSVPYIIPLEEGHSRQAAGPNAIVGRTVIEFQSFIQRALEGLK